MKQENLTPDKDLKEVETKEHALTVEEILEKDK